MPGKAGAARTLPCASVARALSVLVALGYKSSSLITELNWDGR